MKSFQAHDLHYTNNEILSQKSFIFTHVPLSFLRDIEVRYSHIHSNRRFYFTMFKQFSIEVSFLNQRNQRTDIEEQGEEKVRGNEGLLFKV